MIKSLAWTFVFAGIFLGIMLNDVDTKNNTDRNIYNFTTNSFNWTYTVEIETLDINKSNLEESFSLGIRNIVYKSIDLIGYLLFQILNFSIQFGYEKLSDIDSNTIIKGIKLISIIILIVLLIPIIVPFLALCYLLFMGFKWLIIFVKNKNKK